MSDDYRICPVCGGNSRQGCYGGCAVEGVRKLRAELERINLAFAELNKLNAELLVIFAERDAALGVGKQNEGEGQEHVNLSR